MLTLPALHQCGQAGNRGKPKTMETHDLQAKVIDPKGNALENVTVTVAESPQPTPEIAALSNEEGLFSFGGLVYGNYTLRFMSGEMIVLKPLKFTDAQRVYEFEIP